MEKVKLLIKGFVTNIAFSSILFICAGRMDYTQGWIFLSINILATLMNYFTIHKNSELINERSKPSEGIKSWDKLLLGLSALIYVIIIVLAGLDSGRFHWTLNFNWNVSISGVILTLVGQTLFLTARSQNNFFSSVVRIQKDRGHVVCDTGLYKIVRHPGYLGMIISLIGLPLITISVWSIIPTLIAIILLLIRTSLEDKTLINELDGYVEYTKKTRSKLIPFVW
ncbi:MAG: isoprenylcysteine carboxylmethyltransferase family protein [Bacteroidales bacterium]|nr:isoprenylcysteine carboxylmethyltransferase family protein [Bacteroidales bacterium]